MNIGKKLLSLLTVFCLTLSLVPTVVLAEGTSTNDLATEVKFAKTSYDSNYITLNASTPYLSSNGSAASDHQPSGGYAYFHDGILTLNGFTHTKGISATGNLMIELKGDSKIGTESYSHNGDTPNNDIIIGKEDSIHANLTIIGDGSLTLKKAENSTLFVNGDLTIKEGAKVTAEGGNFGQAIDSNGNIIVDGTNTELTATKGNDWAIQAGNGSGTITVQNGAKIKSDTINVNRTNGFIVDGTAQTFVANQEFSSTCKSTFTVTLPTGTGYTVKGETTVAYGESYTFTVKIDGQYRANTNFSVKVNDVAKTANSGTIYTYTIPNVRENLTITVEGVEENVLATPDGTGISFAAKSENRGELTVPTDRFTYQYSVDGAVQWTDATTTTEISGVTTDKGIQVRLKETETAKASAPYTINVTKAKEPTDLTGQAPTSSTAMDGKITGVSNTMEYKAENASNWSFISGDTIENLASGTYYVRVKATDTTLASDSTEVTVGAYVTKYQVWVNGTQVTEANKDNVLNDSNLTHSVTYTPAIEDTPAKLILTNAVINNEKERPASGPMYYILPNGITAKEELQIIVKGTENTITSEHGCAITSNKDLTICGDGSLMLNSQNDSSALTTYYYSRTITIEESVKITATVDLDQSLLQPGEPSAGMAIAAYNTNIQDAASVTAINHGTNWAVYSHNQLIVKDSAILTARSQEKGKTICHIVDSGRTITASVNFGGNPLDGSYDSGKLSTTYKYVKVEPSKTVDVTDVTLNKSMLSMKVGESDTLTATVTPTNATNQAVTWTSSNETVATVTNGTVNAVGVGTATITVTTTDGSYTASCTVTVTRASSSGGSHTTYYPVNTPAKSEGGSVVVSPKSASKGSAVTVTVTPESGYQVSSVQAVDKDGKKLTLTDKGDGKYTFVMPGSKVEVSASFAQVQKPEEASPYRDVSKDSYYYDAVQWASNKGITNGVADGVFAPDWVCTRGQIVTFLWRSVGSPAPKTAEMTFADVAEDAYYAQAVLWAVENGITKGTSETTFSPNETCTRAHAVAFLYRLAGSPAVTGSSFQDVAADAYYNAAVAWAVQQGITKGTSETTFSPNETCTRAQIVTFLYRMDQAK